MSLQLVRAAQEEAQEIKRRAHAEALAEGRKEGLSKGIEEGRKLGRDEALAEQRQTLAQLVSALTQASEELDAQRIALEAEAKQAVVRLAIAIADKVCKRQGALDENVALANIDEALRLVVSSADVRIAVHPTQRAALAETLPRITAKWPNLKHVELIAPNAPGGVTCPHGLFDFTTTGCTPGATLSFTITYPAALPAGTQYWKYGPVPGAPPASGPIVSSAVWTPTACWCSALRNLEASQRKM